MIKNMMWIKENRMEHLISVIIPVYKVEKYLVGQNVYFDLAFCLDKIDFGQLARIIKNHGSDKILFGSDSPWASQKEYNVLLNALPISDADKENIAFKNAFEILSIESFKTLTL